jgi:ATP-dependent Lon protease
MIDPKYLPPGYWVTYGHILNLALPEAVATQLKAHDDECEQRKRDELNERQQEKRAAAQAQREGRAVSPPPDEPPRGWHRVLPDYLETIRSLSEDAVTARTPDREARERLVAIGRRLAERGPDREIGRPDGWRSALQHLEAQMPNFREPIGVVRNALRLADIAGLAPRIPPLLLLGPPGIGKTLFSQRLAQLLAVPHASIAFDQPSAGSQLRGSDKYWVNSECGLLFNLVCLGSLANPLILLDELDKSATTGSRRDLDPLAQLHGALEVQTARRIKDVSVDVEFDASLVTYVATANSLHGIGLPLLSRFEVFEIGPPTRDEAVEVARQVTDQVLERLKLKDRVALDPKCAYVLAHLSPRLMLRTVERLAAAALSDKRTRVTAEQVWDELGPREGPPLH